MHVMSDSNSQNTPNQTPNPGATGIMPTAEALAAAAAAMGTDTHSQHAAASLDPLADAQAELANVKAQNATLADQYLRAQADVQNARRRADEEISKARKFAVEGFADSLLPVLDSLEAGLAIQNVTPEQLREGAEATLRQLKSALERNKVIEINPAAGTKFDPHHQCGRCRARSQHGGDRFAKGLPHCRSRIAPGFGYGHSPQIKPSEVENSFFQPKTGQKDANSANSALKLPQLPLLLFHSSIFRFTGEDHGKNYWH
jgi:molecular chaperone GrpE